MFGNITSKKTMTKAIDRYARFFADEKINKTDEKKLNEQLNHIAKHVNYSNWHKDFKEKTAHMILDKIEGKGGVSGFYESNRRVN